MTQRARFAFFAPLYVFPIRFAGLAFAKRAVPQRRDVLLLHTNSSIKIYSLASVIGRVKSDQVSVQINIVRLF